MKWRNIGPFHGGRIASVNDKFCRVFQFSREELLGADPRLLHAAPYPPDQLADALQARQVPFVFATGYGAQAIPARYQHVPRFEKPLDLDQLVRAVIGS